MNPHQSPFWDLILRQSLGARRLKAGLAAAGVATALSAPLLLPSQAEAQDPEILAEAGAFIGYHFGGGEHAFTWGVEGRVGPQFGNSSCNDGLIGVAMTSARLSMIELRPQLNIGLQAGALAGPSSLVAEWGFGYRFGESGGLSMPVGIELQAFVATTYFRYDSLLDDASIGAGVLFPEPDREMGCVLVGRPLHDETGRAPLPKIALLNEPRYASDLSAETSQAVAREWGERARAEWASVPAFIELAEQLRIANAPNTLVQRALRAADDEVRHAKVTAQASSCYSGAEIRLGAAQQIPRAPVGGDSALLRLAVESYVDGCLGEGTAAAAAEAESTLAQDPTVRSIQSMIARDESTHAELAWDILDWAVDAGGDDVRSAVWDLRAASPGESSGAPDEFDLSEHGLLSKNRHRQVQDRVRESSERRLSQVLS